MPKAPNQDKKKKAESKALWTTTVVFIVIGSLLFVVFTWARTDGHSELAKKIRELTGIVLITEQAPAPEPTPVVVETPVVEEPEPEPAPIEPVDPEPQEPEELDWSEFRNKKSLWPDTLKISVDREVALNYRGNTYGEVVFNSGQLLNVSDISKDGFVSGRTSGIEMEVHVSATNFDSWFEKQHSEDYEITVPEKETAEPSDDYEDELITQLRIWCLQNYNTPLVQIKKDNIVMRLHAEADRDTNSNYAMEAMTVARAYLRIQAKLGGHDNYASCEIRDPDTDELLGSKGIFIPRF